MSVKKNKNKSKTGAYSYDFRLRAVKLHLEEGYEISMLSEELGIGKSTLSLWIRNYRKTGEDGLRHPSYWRKKSPVPKVPEAVKEKIVELKKESPKSGVKRISQVLKRFFFMGASPETVRKTLHEAELMEPPSRKKPQRNIQKPRFFERATPNQLWQSDIMCFRLAGRNAYIIGYIDDYSRYITGLGLYRSQTAEHVIETYRKAISEYGVPKEMLTDNGRQYTNWRGTTRFEKELSKDRIKHIKSRPHHPMTLGKIERFWKTLLEEFLYRAQFTSFENACERLAIWLKYYNHKRPHQGINGLCPADRFFEIQHELKKALDAGVAENALELALRGKPVDPFYMVGRMGEQNVVIRAEKGKVRMMVDGEENDKEKEMVYELEKEGVGYENKEETREADFHCGREEQSSSFDMEREAQRHGSEPGNRRMLRPVKQVAEPCHGRHAVGVGVEERAGENACFESEIREAPGKEIAVSQGEFWEGEKANGEYSESGRGEEIAWEEAYDEWEEERGQSPYFESALQDGRDHIESEERPFDGGGRGENPGSLPQDLLQMGEAGSVGPCQCPRCQAERAARNLAGGAGKARASGRDFAPQRAERPVAKTVVPQRQGPPVGAGYPEEGQFRQRHLQ
jgi:transposase InsO family protein